jgi:hypothetical protein
MSAYAIVRRATAKARYLDRKASHIKTRIFGSDMIPHLYHVAYHRLHTTTYAAYFGSLAVGAHDLYVGAAAVMLILIIIGAIFGEG